MKHASPLAGCLLLVAMLGPGSAAAQDQQPRAAGAVKPPDKTPQAQAERAGQPGRKADQVPQKTKPPRRRPVQQAVGPEPLAPSSAPPALTYGPTLAPRPHEPPSNANSLPSAAPAPAPVNTCHGSLCTDASGGSYNMGVGNAGTNGQGQLCNRVGNTVQCF
ncbi:MAG: hypothetical protein ACJ8LG_03725 [Massilia sp.]